MNQVENAIINDLESILSRGAKLPTPEPGFRPLERTIFVGEHHVTYRVIKLANGTISIPTYFIIK